MAAAWVPAHLDVKGHLRSEVREGAGHDHAGSLRTQTRHQHTIPAATQHKQPPCRAREGLISTAGGGGGGLVRQKVKFESAGFLTTTNPHLKSHVGGASFKSMQKSIPP